MIDETNGYGHGRNDGVFPEETPVLVRYPLHAEQADDRSSWPWLPGTVLEQCGPNEWLILVEVSVLAEPGPAVSDDANPGSLLYPACFRDSTEIRAAGVQEWLQARSATER